VKPAGISRRICGILKDRINELATNSKKKNIRDLCRRINGFRKSYQPVSKLFRTRIVIYFEYVEEIIILVIEYTCT
jgi:hypothetical protein